MRVRLREPVAVVRASRGSCFARVLVAVRTQPGCVPRPSDRSPRRHGVAAPAAAPSSSSTAPSTASRPSEPERWLTTRARWADTVGRTARRARRVPVEGRRSRPRSRAAARRSIARRRSRVEQGRGRLPCRGYRRRRSKVASQVTPPAARPGGSGNPREVPRSDAVHEWPTPSSSAGPARPAGPVRDLRSRA